MPYLVDGKAVHYLVEGHAVQAEPVQWWQLTDALGRPRYYPGMNGQEICDAYNRRAAR